MLMVMTMERCEPKWFSLNGRPAQNLADPSVDLTEVPRPWFGHANWILPLEEPLQTGNK